MATLVLTVIGGAIGGPFGAALGATLGQSLDQRLFGPKGRSGPRLGELAVQSSTYGGALPRVHGRARLSGQVIWATDLTETREKVKTGKGQPKQTVYSYSANFAVALSSRRIESVGRIWADGKLLRGEAGDFKTPTQFRLYTGSEDQQPDPFILSAEGAGQAPAYRGLAYAVFENFQLGDYGNRIPSLSFEVIADDHDVSFGAIISDLLPGDMQSDCSVMLGGMAVTGTDVRALIDSVSPAITLRAQDDGIRVMLTDQVPPTPVILLSDLASSVREDRGDSPSGPYRLTRNSSRLPVRLDLSYYDSLRDYQPGLQRARRGASGTREDALNLAATLLPEQARALAETALHERWRGRDRISVRLPWHALPLRPGQRVALPGVSGEWLVRSNTLEAMLVELELERVALPIPVYGAAPGRVLTEPDLIHGPTHLHVLDIPWLESGTASHPQLLVAANGAETGWRRAALSISLDLGITWAENGLTAAPAVIGETVSALLDGSPYVFDTINTVTVTLLRTDLTLTSADRAALLAGRNLALIGEELVQFEQAELIAPGRYRLSGLLRGRRGTEWAMASHSIGERFILIERDALAVIPLPGDAAQVMVMAIGQGDDDPAVHGATSTLAAVTPPAPAHFSASKMTNGDTALSWTRRSRAGWSWADQVDAPLVEEVERYIVTITPSNAQGRTVTVEAPHWTYSAADRSADITGGASSVTISVRQSGLFAPSRAASVTLALS